MEDEARKWSWGCAALKVSILMSQGREDSEGSWAGEGHPDSPMGHSPSSGMKVIADGMNGDKPVQ